MPLTLNREARQKLFDEDMVWLLAQPRTLERDHIEQILRWAMATCGTTQPKTSEVVQKLKNIWRDQLNIGAAPSLLREAFEEMERLVGLNRVLAKTCGCLEPDEFGRSCCDPPCIACQALEDCQPLPH